MTYPTSQVICEALVAVGGVIQATVGLDLNFVDRRLLDEYGPSQVDFGGTFGVNSNTPLGITLLQDIRLLSSGMSVTKQFASPTAGHPEYAVPAATEWYAAVTSRISTQLVALRAADTATVLGNQTITQV